MGSSKYPNKLDTSIEIPAVRDNIVEVGSDVINSLRSAIFNIERTLGINPQGATGNTVASRLNSALDGNGNVLKETLDKAGLLSGPITNSDVAKSAGIDESKLKLEYPTTLLQDEISQLIKQLDTISSTLEELSYLFAAHTHPEAKNRHKGLAVTIDAIERVSSDKGMVSSEMQTSQDLFEKIFSSHINYDGSNISSSNRSHEAKQVFFDNNDVSSFIESEDVQGAIIDVLNQTSGQLEVHQDLHHSNGVLRTGTITGPGLDSVGPMILDEEKALFYKTTSDATEKTFVITLVDQPDIPNTPIQKSDILRLYSAVDGSEEDFQIHSILYDGTGTKISSVEVYGKIGRNSISTDVCRIFVNKNKKSNSAALLASVRPYPGHSNADIIQIANPNAATIFTRNIRPSEISISNRYLSILVDDKEISVDVYNGASPERQTVDSIVAAMNEAFALNAASVLAYRLDSDDLLTPEIALVHSLASSVSETFTLTVKRGTDDAIDSLGLGYIEDEEVNQGSGTEFFIQGRSFSNLGVKLEYSGLTLISGTSTISSSAAGISFTDYSISKGDVIIITNTVNDNGTYVIKKVTETSLQVDKFQLSGGTWNGESTDESIFTVIKNTVCLEELEFATNAVIADIFLDKNLDLFYNKRLNHELVGYMGSSSLISPCDFTGDTLSYEGSSPGIISASLNADGVPQVSLDGGPIIEMPLLKKSYLTLESGASDISLLVYIEDSEVIFSKITNDGPFEIEIYGQPDVNLEENLLIARVLYDSSISKVSGAGSDIPRIFNKIQSGITSDKDLSSSALKRVYQQPIKETRSNGVTRGLNLSPSAAPISDDGYYTVNIDPGTCYVKGKKFSFPGYTDLVSNINTSDADKVFIAINEWGELVFAGADSSGGTVPCACPFNLDSFCILSCLEWDGLNDPISIDLRLHLNNLDLKVLNAITVSPQPGMGHFTDFGDAVRYAKRFKEMFPKAGVPSIHLKSGIHKVVVEVDDTSAGSSGVELNDKKAQAASYRGTWINFPVNITGEGESTVLDIMTTYSDLGEENDDREDNILGTIPKHHGALWIVGPGMKTPDDGGTLPDGDHDTLSDGFVNLSNFAIKNSHIILIDPSIRASAPVSFNLNWGVNIDNVTFDQSDRSSFNNVSYGPMIFRKDSDESDSIGNLNIKNCQFLWCMIKSQGFTANGHQNISLLNNVFRGQGTSFSSGSNMYVFHGGNNSESIISHIDCPPENNVEIRGNIIAESHLPTTAAYFDNESREILRDRVSRSLSVGEFLSINEEPLSSDNYAIRIGYPSGTNSKAGIRVQQGPIYVSDGTLTLNDGDLVMNEGDMTLVDGHATVNSGNLTLNNGDLSILSGNLSMQDGDLNISSGNFTITGSSTFNGNIYHNTGHLYVNDGWIIAQDSAGVIRVKSTEENPAYIQLYGGGDEILNGDMIGTVQFRSTDVDDYEEYLGAVYMEAAGDFTADSKQTRLQFASSGGRGAIIDHRGRLVNVFSGSSGKLVELDKYSGSFIITSGIPDGTDDSDSGQHIAMDYRGVIQSKGNSDISGPIYLNPYGGSVWVSGDTDDKSSGLFVGGPDKPGRGLVVQTYEPPAEAGEDGDNVTSTVYAGNHITAFGLGSYSSTVYFADYPKMGTGTISETQGDHMNFMTFALGSQGIGSITAEDSSTVAYNTFTGQHIAPISYAETNKIKKGMIVCSDGTTLLKNVLSESFSGARLACKKEDKTVYGVCSKESWFPGRLNWAHFDKDTCAISVNSLGNGRVWVTNIKGNVENGDYICSSDIPGFGQLQSDGIMRNYTVAKATEAVDWDSVTDTITYNDVEYKKFLISCTYHCG